VFAGGTHKATNPFGAVHEPLLLRFDWTEGKLQRSHVSDGIPGGLLYRVCPVQNDLAVSVSGGSSGGLLLFYGGEQEKEAHRFALPSLARDMDFHPGTGLLASAHFDNHLRISTIAMA
jgi:hypothetical protein